MFEVVMRKDLPVGMKIIIVSIWAMKKKSNGMPHG